MNACTCCGRNVNPSPSIQRIHLDCWLEHHSDPCDPTDAARGHVCAQTAIDAVAEDDLP